MITGRKKLDSWIHSRVSDEEKEIISRYAEKKGFKSRSQFLIYSALEFIKRYP